MATGKATKRRLPKYLYYFKPRDCYRFKLPGMDRFEYLPSGLSEEEAIRLFATIRERYTTASSRTGKLLTDDIRAWRTEQLPSLVKARSREPVSDRQKYEYRLICENVLEQMDLLRAPAPEVDVLLLRQALAPFLDRPRQYNYCKVVLSHVFQGLVRAGKCAPTHCS